MGTEVTEKDLDRLRKQNDDLREQIASELRKVEEAQTNATLANDKKLLETEQERLKRQLEEAKAQTKAVAQLNTPLEQAEAAAEADQAALNAPVVDPEKNKE